MDCKVKVIIPVYKSALSETERISLERCFSVLNRYEKVFVKPESLDISSWTSFVPGYSFGIESFEDRFFQGVAGYNRLMMSPVFYKRFLETEYILICQLDAFIFDDRLEYWSSLGYDYIGAPWMKKKKYDAFYYRIFSGFRNFFRSLTRAKNYDLWNKVGNGGFSLRKVMPHYKAVCEMGPLIAEYLKREGKSRYNEDVFWSMEVPEWNKNFKIPGWQEALDFAFDINPEECYAYSKKLPFAVHGWDKRKNFYRPFIKDYTGIVI